MHQDSQTKFSIARPLFAIPMIVVISGFIFFWALGDAAYWDRDEPRNAGCAAEMMARGDWVVPTFNDELRQQKPALLYWLMGAAYCVFGVNEFAGRFFSALLAVGTVVATWGITRSFFDRTTALLASLMLASSLMFCVAARAATPDSVLIFCVTMSFWFFARGAVGNGNPFSSRSNFVGIYLFLGLAMLAKGPVGFVLPMAVMGWYLLMRDRDETTANAKAASWVRAVVEPFHPARFWRTLVSMRVVFGVVISLLIAAPWFVAVGIATEGEFLQRFFLDENFGRATKVLESHSGGLWFYPLAILIGFFPWSVFWGPVVFDLAVRTFKGKPTRAKSGLDAGTRFAICWIVIQVVAFSLVKTKLPSYVTPCYPALAILTAHATMRLVRATSLSPDWLWRFANAAMLLSGIGISVGLWIAANKFEPIPSWLVTLGIAPIAMGVLGWIQLGSASSEARYRIAIGGAVVASLFCTGLLGAGAASVGKQNRMVFSELIHQQPNASLATYGCHESSWVYYSGTGIVELRTDGEEEQGAESKLQQRKFWQRKPWLSPNQFAGSSDNGMIITTQEKWSELKKRLPEDWKVVQTADWFLKDEKLLLIANRDSLAPNPKRAEQMPADQSVMR